MKKHSIIEQEIKRIGKVSTCSECCMAEINGKPNIEGMLHRAYLTNEKGRLCCTECPVHLGLSDEEYNRILREIDGQA